MKFIYFFNITIKKQTTRADPGLYNVLKRRVLRSGGAHSCFFHISLLVARNDRRHQAMPTTAFTIREFSRARPSDSERNKDKVRIMQFQPVVMVVPQQSELLVTLFGWLRPSNATFNFWRDYRNRCCCLPPPNTRMNWITDGDVLVLLFTRWHLTRSVSQKASLRILPRWWRLCWFSSWFHRHPSSSSSSVVGRCRWVSKAWRNNHRQGQIETGTNS